MTPYVAVCPECDQFKNLDMLPYAGGVQHGWPYCEDCMVSMNIYRRDPRGKRSALTSTQSGEDK